MEKKQQYKSYGNKEKAPYFLLQGIQKLMLRKDFQSKIIVKVQVKN